MKRIYSLLLIVAASLLVLGTGCSQQRVIWSPDGTKAAILSEDGLYISDSNGKLSGLLVSNVVITEWFRDSQQLGLVRKLKFENWAEIQPHLRPENREFVLETNAQTNVDLYELSVGTIHGGQITLGPALIQTLQEPLPLSVRISPTQPVIALTTDASPRHGGRLWIVETNGLTSAKIVSDETAAHPDWSKDGRSLIYANATGAMINDDDLRLGSLVRRQVVSAAGAVEIQTDHDDLAGMLFEPELGVQCFNDGRILFLAREVQLPATSDDMPGKPQIFAWDPRHKGTLTRMISHKALDQLPDEVQFFEISPDEKSLLIAGGKGAVKVLSLADGKLTQVQTTSDKDVPSFPSWRGDEVCYMVQAPTNSDHSWEVALWKDGTNRVISTNWPAEVRNKFLDN